jgi:hypothetical protein
MINDKRCLIAILSYSIILLTSFIIFILFPEWRIYGIAWNALFQVFGTTLGATLLFILLLFFWLSKRIGGKTFLKSIGILLFVSVVCFAIAFNIMMGV